MPVVAVSREPRVADDSSKASGDRFQIQGAKSSWDWSREVLHSDLPSQESLGQASDDRLQFPGVEAPGDRSHEVPGWLQPFKEGLSGE